MITAKLSTGSVDVILQKNYLLAIICFSCLKWSLKNIPVVLEKSLNLVFRYDVRILYVSLFTDNGGQVVQGGNHWPSKGVKGQPVCGGVSELCVVVVLEFSH